MSEQWSFKPASDIGMPPLKRLRSERREGGLASRIMQRCARICVRIYLKLWHRFEVEGAQNIPAGVPLVVCANHASHIDSVLLAAAMPWAIRRNLFPLAAGDVFFETPIITAFAAYIVNALPMWRKNVGRHALDALKQRLRDGSCGYILFPEGRRSPDGSLLEFKAGVGMMVAGSSTPVLPCFIHGAHLALPRLKVFPRPRKLRITIGKPLTFADMDDSVKSYRAITAIIEREIRLLGGLPAPVAPADFQALSQQASPAPSASIQPGP